LTKSGNSFLPLTNANTFSGDTRISAGMLLVAHPLALQNSILDTTNSVSGGQDIGLRASVDTLTLGGLSGNKNLSSIFTTGNGGSFSTNLNNPAVQSFATPLGGYRGLTSLTLNPGTGQTPTYSGNIVDGAPGMSVIKTGLGTQTLSGTHTYTGATNVNGGTLVINGSTSTTSAFTVANTATLKGQGSIGGSVTIQGGGTLASGTSIESLATGALSLQALATYAYEMNNDVLPAAAGDLTAVTGNLTLDLTNAAILTLTELGGGSWTVGDKLTLISYTGAWNGGLFNYGGTLNDGDTFTFSGIDWEFDYNDTTSGSNFTGDLTGSSFVTMTAIPEPRAALLGGLGLLALLRRRRD
jgi:autotransporter-associated beta strand protein